MTVPVILGINVLFSLLDWIWHDENDTLNYWSHSRKP